MPMTQPVGPSVTPAPPTAHQDGLNRAIRSTIGGIISAALASGGAGLLTALGTVRWTHSYWISLGTLAVSSLLLGVVSYGMRRLVPPVV